MAADDDDFVRLLASANLADDVGRHRRRPRNAPPSSADDDPVAAVGHALQAVGVLEAMAAAGILGAPVGVLQRAGVRQAQSVRADRTNEHARPRRAAPRATPRRCGSGRSRRSSVNGTLNSTMRPRAAPACASSSSKLCTTRLGLHALRRRRDAAAESQHRDLVARRLDDLGALVPAHPLGTITGSVCTFSRPSRFISSTAHLMARSSCGEPLRRWPMVSVSTASRRHANGRSIASPIRRAAGSRYASSQAGGSRGGAAVRVAWNEASASEIATDTRTSTSG